MKRMFICKILGDKCQPFFQILTNCSSDKFEILGAEMQTLDFATVYTITVLFI